METLTYSSGRASGCDSPGLLNMMRIHISLLTSAVFSVVAGAATVQTHYFGHDAIEDRYGVIAPWYKGQNGQYDFRVRIAAETIKRYPWTTAGRAVAPAPEYVYNGTWSIDVDGKITPVEERDWNNGDLPQRAAFLIEGMLDYYRYSGDPAALTHIATEADYLIDHCLTPANPKFQPVLSVSI